MVVMAPITESKHYVPFKTKENQISQLNEKDDEDEVPEDIQIIAQEVQIVKSLACNDLTQRNRQMKRLRKWLEIRTKSSFSFSQEDFMRIWKGLYYNMWYSDKPLVQEELAEQIGKLLECFRDNLQYCVDFFGAFLKTMFIEWFGIDQWRMDKFLMLARRMLRYMFKTLKSFDWSLDAIGLFNKHATEIVLFENTSSKGFTMHYFDIFLEELAKVSDGRVSAEQVGFFIKPFVKFMAVQKDSNLISHCRTRIFYHLLYQSDLGREYTEKYNAWKYMGFPTKRIDDLEKVENGNDVIEDENMEKCSSIKHLDPRAGNVDVLMPELPLDAQHIIKDIEYFLYKEECPTKRRKSLKKLLELFKIYENGKFPLGIKTMPRFECKSEKPLIKEKIKQLNNLENELYGVDRKLKQMTKRKRRKFLKSLNFDDIDESNYEQSLEKALPKDYLKERRKRSKKSFMNSWVEEELNEEDLKPKKAKMDQTVNKQQTKKNKHKLQNFENGETTELVTKIKKQENFNDNTSIKLNKLKQKIDLPKNNNNEDESESCNSEEQLTQLCKKEKVNVLKISDSYEDSTGTTRKKTENEWDEPLCDGEIEYFLPSRKVQLKKANANLVVNPLAKQRLSDIQFTSSSREMTSFSASSSPKTPSSTKRVKIALKNNTCQNPLEYIQQIKSSPNIPYDAKRKPGKGLLKPNAIPSPINPFYKKKIGLKFLNDTV